MTPSLTQARIQIDEVERVGQVDGEPVAALESAGRQGVGHAIAARVDIAEGVGRALPFERRLGRAQAERGIEPVAKIHGAQDETCTLSLHVTDERETCRPPISR